MQKVNTPGLPGKIPPPAQATCLLSSEDPGGRTLAVGLYLTRRIEEVTETLSELAIWAALRREVRAMAALAREARPYFAHRERAATILADALITERVARKEVE